MSRGSLGKGSESISFVASKIISRSTFTKNIWNNNYQSSIMKLRYSALVTALAIKPIDAWTNVPLHQMRPASGRHISIDSTKTVNRPIDSTSSPVVLKSVAGALELPAMTTPALIPSGKLITKGSVVSAFSGGLVAVRLEDDFVESSDKKTDEEGKSTIGGDLIGRQVVFPGGLVGVVVTHRPPVVFVYCDFDNLEEISKFEKNDIQVLDSFASIALSIDGQTAVDCFGRELDEKYPGGASSSSLMQQRAIFAPIPQVKDIALINTPLVTGITMLDALAPIGMGQNMLLVGHNLDDMRRYVCDILSTQSKDGMATKCVYAACQDSDKIQAMLKEAGVSDDVTLVTTQNVDNSGKDKASKAAEATAIAAAACAVGESFAIQKGIDSLVIVDTIDQHKQLWDTTTRVLVDVFGVEAVVKGDREGGASSEMRAFYSSLIQRSAQYKKSKGGGSVTLILLTSIPSLSTAEDADTVFSPSDFEGTSAKVQERIDLLVKRNIPLTAANLRKIDIPIPSDAEGGRRLALQHIDDLISMSDGQIWMDEQLEQAGRQPPMDAQRSVTRIGIGADTESRADAPAMRRIVEGLRLDFAQAASMDGADFATNASIRQVKRSKALVMAMHQPAGTTGRSLSESCTAMLAAAKGYLDGTIDEGVEVGTEEGDRVMRELFQYVKTEAADVVMEIDTTKDLRDVSLIELEDTIKSFFS